MRYAMRSLRRSSGYALTIVVTLALGIGANTAIFSVLRGVLLRPLVNREAERIVYIRQSAPALGVPNATFSVPEIQDLRERLKSFTVLGDFSTANFTAAGLGEPRELRAGVVGSAYFAVMRLSPVIGRLFDSRDDGPSAAGAVVLTHRFWRTALQADPSVIGRVVRLGNSFGRSRGSFAAFRALSRRNRNTGEHRHQPAPSLGDHEDRAASSHDGVVWTPCTRRDFGAGSHGAPGGVRGDEAGNIRKHIRKRANRN